MKKAFCSLVLFLVLFSCLFESAAQKVLPKEPAGKLFIIGGGKRPPALIKRLVQEAGIDKGGWAIILPQASAEPDSALWYAKKQFTETGLRNIAGFVADTTQQLSKARLDSIRQAKLIYLPGGDQSRLMRLLMKMGAADAIREAYQRGATIAGTSAGAAVMSRQMITGTEKQHPDYHETFRHLEANNLELQEGLGLLPAHILIDQHFVQRSRYNRLLTAIIENPSWLGLGIDEATALLITGNKAEVVGDAQVIAFRNPQKSSTTKNNLLSGQNLRLDVYLPGDTFSLSSR